MALFPKPAEINTHNKWQDFIRQVRPVLDKLEWNEKRDFLPFMEQIDLEYKKLDNLYVENRRHPRLEVRQRIENQKSKIEEYITLLITQLMISKLYSVKI